ncbi:hypothetical protein VB775_22160 [Pseudanabaena sp. CCNP1317]|nr:hypothetical protein [Pseudanabaena sp. CCNP1317]MEA5489523.1 hypothetical protein [Pseudanabaena sp. CCNP1317]
MARQIENIADKQLQSNVAASTAIISGIALSKEIIKRLLRSDIMKESVIYQEILHEGTSTLLQRKQLFVAKLRHKQLFSFS